MLSSPELKSRIITLFEQLRDLSSLEPGPRVNALFTELVGLTELRSDADAGDAMLDDPEIAGVLPQLRSLCSQGEYQLELHWANTICQSRIPVATLEQFPYFSNYQKLTDLEYQALRLGGRRRVRKVLFVGSGPLPLSVILLARQYGLQVDGVDIDEQAIRVSRRLVGALGLNDLVGLEVADATTFDRYAEYDAVVLAALVGLDSEIKSTLIARVRDAMRPGALLVLRSAAGLRRILYPEVPIEPVAGLEAQAIVHPLNEVVNSVLVYLKPLGAGLNELMLEDKHALGVAKRFQQFCQAYIADVYGYGHNPAWHADIDRAEEIYGQERSNLFVIRQGERTVAAAAIRPYDRDYDQFRDRYGDDVGSVWRFFVEPEYQGLGLEGRLMDELEAFARQAGFRLLYAHDQRDVPGAVGRYLASGYAVTHESNDRFGTIHFEKEIVQHD